MTIDDIHKVQNQFVESVKVALSAGFDGVELHAANGYIIDQFLRSSSNKRTDQYGGSTENRARFLLEILDKISAVLPLNKVGAKLSLAGRYNSMKEDNPLELGKYLCQEFDKRGVLYIQFMEADSYYQPAYASDPGSK